MTLERDARPDATDVAAPAPVVGRPASRATAQRTRQRILDAALEEFSAKGFDAGRVDEIALRAGVQKNVIYYYFGSKDDLFTAVLEATYAAIRARQQDLELRRQEPVAAMRQLVVFTGRIWMEQPHFQRLLHSANLHGARHVRRSARIAQLYDPLVRTLRELVERGQAAGRFRADVDPVDLYISISSLTAHYVSHHHTFEALFDRRLMTPARVRARLEHAADMVVAYLCSPADAAHAPRAQRARRASPARRPRG